MPSGAKHKDNKRIILFSLEKDDILKKDLILDLDLLVIMNLNLVGSTLWTASQNYGGLNVQCAATEHSWAETNKQGSYEVMKNGGDN